MEIKELNEALEGIKAQVANATASNKEALEGQIKALETKVNDSITAGVKEATEALQAEIKAVQEHADKLDVKMKNGSEQIKQNFTDMMVKSIEENAADISRVSVGQKHVLKMDGVKVMTVADNLTGDSVITYQNGVVMLPGQMVNFAQLVPTVSSATGTYVIYRETGKTGDVGLQTTPGTDKEEVNYNLEAFTYNATYLAGLTRYAKQMAQDVPFLTSFLPQALRRDYFKAENAIFHTALATEATASTLTTGNEIERLVNNIAVLEGLDYGVNGVVINPGDWAKIATTEKSTGAGYGLPGIVTIENGQLAINGINVYKASWMPANKYAVGDWTQAKKVVVDGLSVEFFEQDRDNVIKNLITARIESRTVLAFDQPAAFIYGDFTTTP